MKRCRSWVHLAGCWLAVAAGAAPTPSAKPFPEEMVLVFSEEFEGATLNPAVWASQACEKGLSRNTARGPDNLEVRDGHPPAGKPGGLRLRVCLAARLCSDSGPCARSSPPS